ncbi:MAG: sulfate adenylyltransferase subunit CysN [Pirellulales bacterium]
MALEPVSATLTETAQFLMHDGTKDLLRFITCGSVDDGKSTLIGRLLLEAGAVYDDQIAALRHETARHGTVDVELDPALLLDGLEDERQQGITIDVAYRYFQTAQRKFIIADSPGHEQYTRNMATAASTAHAAVILLDARKGILPQTRRHAFIASLLGVRTLILAVNKMDLVDYRQEVFDALSGEFRQFAEKLNSVVIHAVPVSGLRGDNVGRLSDLMPWYQGLPLLELLESVPVPSGDQTGDFRFPVQRVSRPNAEFRGYSGTVAGGQVKPGDRVIVLPGRQKSRVRSIVTFDGEPSEAAAGAAVTLTLEDELDIARGDMIVHLGRNAEMSRELDATLIWMSSQPLVVGKTYWLKLGPKQVAGEVQFVSHRVDVNTLNQVEVASLGLNEIGRCRISLQSPVAFDPYRRNRSTGSFIIVDRVTHETVAAGMIADAQHDVAPSEHWNVELRSRQLQFSPSQISPDQRRLRYGHPPLTVLLTGLSGSGKTTLALLLEERLFAAGRAVTVLDGQNLRHGISRDLGFSADERSENLRRAAEICRMINDAGLICIAAFVAPDEVSRHKARDVIGRHRLVHIHLSASTEICRERDKSGRYQAADRGEIVNFPGVSASYEIPRDADLVVPTDEWDVAKSLSIILQTVEAKIAASAQG